MHNRTILSIILVGPTALILTGCRTPERGPSYPTEAAIIAQPRPEPLHAVAPPPPSYEELPSIPNAGHSAPPPPAPGLTAPNLPPVPDSDVFAPTVPAATGPNIPTTSQHRQQYFPVGIAQSSAAGQHADAQSTNTTWQVAPHVDPSEAKQTTANVPNLLAPIGRRLKSGLESLKRRLPRPRRTAGLGPRSVSTSELRSVSPQFPLPNQRESFPVVEVVRDDSATHETFVFPASQTLQAAHATDDENWSGTASAAETEPRRLPRIERTLSVSGPSSTP